MTKTQTKVQINEWLVLHNIHYDRLSLNNSLPNPLKNEAITEMYHDQLRQYFEKYPDDLTDYYAALISIPNTNID